METPPNTRYKHSERSIHTYGEETSRKTKEGEDRAVSGRGLREDRQRSERVLSHPLHLLAPRDHRPEDWKEVAGSQESCSLRAGLGMFGPGLLRVPEEQRDVQQAHASATSWDHRRGWEPAASPSPYGPKEGEGEMGRKYPRRVHSRCGPSGPFSSSSGWHDSRAPSRHGAAVRPPFGRVGTCTSQGRRSVEQRHRKSRTPGWEGEKKVREVESQTSSRIRVRCPDRNSSTLAARRLARSSSKRTQPLPEEHVALEGSTPSFS